MEITQKNLKDWSACTDGYKWACGVLKDKPMDDVKFLEVLMKEDRYDWANWVIVRVMTYDQYVGYAVYAAEQVIDIYEKKCPDDKRPRLAIEAAKNCIGLKGDAAWAARAAARAAAGDAEAAAGDTAWVDAWAAEDAVWAARVAAWAAEAAAWAARAAARAAARDAEAAARDAAWAAAQKQMQIKILEYGLSLLE